MPTVTLNDLKRKGKSTRAPSGSRKKPAKSSGYRVFAPSGTPLVAGRDGKILEKWKRETYGTCRICKALGHFAPNCPLDQGSSSTDVVEPTSDVAEATARTARLARFAAAPVPPPAPVVDEKDLECPISLERLVEPVTAPCGCTFEKAEIETWREENNKCPTCGDARPWPRGSWQLHVNTRMRNIMEAVAPHPQSGYSSE
jgi:hypothetical protein